MSLRSFMDRLAPDFEKGGRYHAFYPVYEAIDTALYTPGHVTAGASHVRDGLDLKRIMITVWAVAWIPAVVGSYLLGNQALLAMESVGVTGVDNWRGPILDLLIGYNAASLWDCLIYGLAHFLPLYIVTFVAGIACEILFASRRGHEVNEGFFVTSILFALILPPTTPLWQAVVGIVFGVVIGKEVFGGTGKNFLNPALVGRAFLYFAYPAQMSGDAVWVAVDGYTRATPLGNAAIGDPYGVSWLEAFLGTIPGSIGETSFVAILVAAAILLLTRIASWRIMLGCVLGLVVTAALFNMIDSTNPMFAMPFYWHLVIGGFAFGAVFMATDPVTAAHTNTGRLWFGFMIGMLTVLIRVVNPAFPEGIMLAILFSNLFAPLIDYVVVQRNVKRRLARA